MAKFPVEVRTPAGPIALREEAGELFLTGPAVLIGEGEFWA
jgi:diaminopimelate epimerase